MADLIVHDDDIIRERTCMALTIMAELNSGRKMICKNKLLLDHLALAVEDIVPAVKMKAAVLIEMLSRVWMGMQYNNYFIWLSKSYLASYLANGC